MASGQGELRPHQSLQAPVLQQPRPRPEGPRSQKQRLVKPSLPNCPHGSLLFLPLLPGDGLAEPPSLLLWAWLWGCASGAQTAAPSLQAAVCRAFAHAELPPMCQLASPGPGRRPGCGHQQVLVFLPLLGDGLFLLLPESVFVIWFLETPSD